VDNHWQVTITRRPQLTLENIDLDLAWRVVIMKVEANLTPGDNACTTLNHTLYSGFCLFVIEPSVMGVSSDGSVDGINVLAQSNRTFQSATVRISRPDVQDNCDTCGMRSLDNLCSIDVELGTVNVRVRIDEHLN
jgi:hypothetical protein